MHPDWVRFIRDQCAAAGVPFLFKQWGEWKPGRSDWNPGERLQNARWIENDGTLSDWGKPQTGTPYWVSINGKKDICPNPGPLAVFMTRVGKKAAGRILDGVIHDEFPAEVARA